MTSPGRGGKKGLTICSQNVCGLKQDEHVEGLFSAVHDRRIFAACVQETWRDGCEDRVRSGALFLGIGLNYNSPQQSRRGSQVVVVELIAVGWKYNHKKSYLATFGKAEDSTQQAAVRRQGQHQKHLSTLP